MSGYTLPRAWFDAVDACTKHDAAHVVHIMRHWFAVLSVGAVRVPHVEREPIDDSVVFTWKRDGHYLDFTVLSDGRVEWFYKAPHNTHHRGTHDEPTADLPPEFFEHVRKYATPTTEDDHAP